MTDKVRQVDWHGGFTAARRPRALHGPELTRSRTGTAPPSSPSRPATWSPTFTARAEGAATSHASQRLEPAGQQRRVDRADRRRGRPRRQRLGRRLVQLHRPAQPHAPGLQDRQGQRLRDPAPRQDARPDLSRDRPRRASRPRRPPLDPADADGLVEALKSDNQFWRLHAQRLLVERGKPDVVAGADRPGRRPNGRRDRPEHRRDPRPLDASGARRRSATTDAEQGRDGRRSSTRRPASAATRSPCSLTTRRPPRRSCRPVCCPTPTPRSGSPPCLSLADTPSAGQGRERPGDGPGERPRRRRPLADRRRHERRGSPRRTVPQGPRLDQGRGRAVGDVAKRRRAGRRALRAGRAGRIDRRSPRRLDPGGRPAVQPGGRRADRRRREQGMALDLPAKLDADGEAALVKLAEQLPLEARGRLVNLGSKWGSKAMKEAAGSIAKNLLAKLGDESKPDADRIQAGREVVELRPEDDAVAAEIVEQITPRTSPTLATALVEALTKGRARGTGKTLLSALSKMTPSTRTVAIRALLGRADWTGDLLDAIDSGAVGWDQFTLDQKQALVAHPSKAVADRAKQLIARGGGLPDRDRQAVIDQLSKVVLQGGDPTARQEGLHRAVRQVPQARRRRGQRRPRPQRHGRAPEGRAADPHHRPEPERRGELHAVHGRHHRRPGAQRPAGVRVEDVDRAARRRGQDARRSFATTSRSWPPRRSRSCPRASRSR